MNIYNYSPQTGEFIGVDKADPDPLVSGNWLIPAHATTLVVPNTSEGEVAVFDGSMWVVVQDYRGQKYWLPDGTEHVVVNLDDTIPTDASLTPPPLPAEAKVATVEHMVTKHLYEVALADGWDSPISCIARASYEGPWRQHGIVFGQWSDACWEIAFSVQREIKDGVRDDISEEELIALLPKITWPV